MEQSGLGLNRERKVKDRSTKKTELVDDLRCLVNHQMPDHGICCADDLRASCFDDAGHFGRHEMKVQTAVRSNWQHKLDSNAGLNGLKLKLSFDRLSKCRKSSSLAAWCDYELCEEKCGREEHRTSDCCCAGCCCLNRVAAISVPTAEPEPEATRPAGEPKAAAVGVQ